MQRDDCNIDLIRLADGAELGSIRAAYTQTDNVLQISDDLIAVLSSGNRDARNSIQIFDLPNLNPGPWLVDGDLQDGEDESQPSPRTRLSYPRPLVPFEPMGHTIVGDGKYLYLKQDEKRGLTLSIPPWGKRLRDLMSPR